MEDEFDDVGALEDVGAPPRALMRMLRRGRRVHRPRVVYNAPRAQVALRKPPIVQAVPGVSPPALKYLPFGLGSVNLGVGVTTGSLTQQPQIPLKVRKLTIGVGRNGASVATALVLITAFNIGTINQFAGAGNVDTAAFIANAEGSVMDLSPAGPGINVSLNFLSTIAPGAGDSIDISATFLAQAVTS